MHARSGAIRLLNSRPSQWRHERRGCSLVDVLTDPIERDGHLGGDGDGHGKGDKWRQSTMHSLIGSLAEFPRGVQHMQVGSEGVEEGGAVARRPFACQRRTPRATTGLRPSATVVVLIRSRAAARRWHRSFVGRPFSCIVVRFDVGQYAVKV